MTRDLDRMASISAAVQDYLTPARLTPRSRVSEGWFELLEVLL